MQDRRGWSLYLGVPGARGGEVSQPGDHPRAPPFSSESAVAQHLAPHQVTRARTLRAARPSGSPAARAEPRRAPSDCSAPSHTRPARSVTQPGNRRRPGASRLEAKRPRHPPQHVSVRPCRSRSVPAGPWRGRDGDWHHPGRVGGVASPPYPQPVRSALGGRTSSSPAPPPPSTR